MRETLNNKPLASSPGAEAKPPTHDLIDTHTDIYIHFTYSMIILRIRKVLHYTTYELIPCKKPSCSGRPP